MGFGGGAGQVEGVLGRTNCCRSFHGYPGQPLEHYCYRLDSSLVSQTFLHGYCQHLACFDGGEIVNVGTDVGGNRGLRQMLMMTRLMEMMAEIAVDDC